jgi:hypothetical protein
MRDQMIMLLLELEAMFVAAAIYPLIFKRKRSS